MVIACRMILMLTECGSADSLTLVDSLRHSSSTGAITTGTQYGLL